MYQGHDPVRLHQVLNQHFTPHGMDLIGRRPLDATFRAWQTQAMTTCDLSCGTNVLVTPVQPPQQYVIRIAHIGRASLRVEGRATPFSPSIVSPGMVVTGRWDADTAARFICVPRHLVDHALRTQLDGEPDSAVAFESRFDESRADVRTWLALARTFSEMAEAGAIQRSPLAAGHLEQVLVHTLLMAQPHNFTGQLAAQRSRVLGPGVIHRAVRYCEENPQRPISVPDIAAAARVSVRTLHAEFQRKLGTTPLRYLRGLRLGGAHAELRAIARGQGVGTVAQVAARWGFPNRRYFSDLYRRSYGVSPSRTIGDESAER